jgi:hypothetical protein
MKSFAILLIIGSMFISKTSLAADPVSYAAFDELLKKYVSAKGNVNYKGFKTESAKLDEFCKTLEANPPKESWTTAQKKAFWINAYNAMIIKLVIKHYPVTSVKKVVKAGKPWNLKFFKIGDIEDLDGIEHKILRKMGDPKIHVGINCASFSCPKLNNKAFTADNVDSELESLMKEFVNDQTKNKITAKKLELSEIFNWFKDDFTKKGSLIEFLNKYSTVKINDGASISHLKYNWNLNE